MDNTDDKRLFLLDAYGLIYRAYYALIRSPRFTSTGMNTSAIFGFVNALDDVLRKENPSHIAVCFDPPHGVTFRHELYPDYKAQRQAQPEDITVAVPIIKEIITAYRIPILEVARYEADDVIGTVARLAEKQGFTTYMMTLDKDYGQLVTDRTLMYRPSLRGKDFEIRGPQQVCERYGIERPEQVIDILALEGDVSDNIPGCPGVGEKRARDLIRAFGSVENLLANVDKVKGTMGRNLADNAAQIRFSRQLVTIKTDVPIEVDFDHLRREPEDVDALRAIYKRLEFKSFLAKLSAPAMKPEAADAPVQLSLFEELPEAPEAGEDGEETPQLTAVVVEEVTDPARVSALVAAAIKAGEAGLATYAPGEEAMRASLRGIALSAEAGRAAYIPVPADEGKAGELMVVLDPLFASETTTIVSHDVKRDMLLLRRHGVRWTAPCFDTSVAHYLLQPEMRHTPGDVAQSVLRYNVRGSLDEPARRKPYAELIPDEARARIGEQAGLMAPLRRALTADLRKSDLYKLLEDIELPMVRVLEAMEWTGVRVDVEELRRLSVSFTERLQAMEKRCFELAGHSFKLSSPKQVGDVLFEELKLDPTAKRTKSGNYSTAEDILEKLRADNEIVDLILKIRALQKLLATYVNNLPTLINPHTGKLHTTFNQTVTATGRISSTNPNLQNIPVRTDDGRDIRRAIIPDPGHILMAADYSQIELRLMADLSGDPDMIEAFASGADIHRSTAAKIYHLDPEEVTPILRRNAKTANFGIIYGISAFGLSERLGIPRSESKMLIDGYFNTYPHVKEYISRAIESARRDGYVTTIMGRKRYLPDINSRNAVVRSYAERNAVNAPLQGSAADIIKLAMIRIFDKMNSRGMHSRMILQVHDELVFDVVPDELADLQHLVLTEMEGAYRGKVTLEVSSGVGANWLDAH